MECEKNPALILTVSILVIFSVLMPSCNRSDKSHLSKTDEQETLYQAFSQAVFYEEKNPDSALTLTNKALEMMQNLKIQSKDTLFKLLEMKAYILLRKSQSDTALLMLSDVRLTPDFANDLHFQAKIALLVGSIALNNKKIEVAEKYLPESIVLFEKLNQEQLAAEAYNIYGILLLRKSD